MASAGGCLAARQRECSVPIKAETMLIRIAEITTHGFNTKTRDGKR